MDVFEAVIALLHVSALVGAISAVYAGLDRGGAGVRQNAVYPEAQKIAANILNSLGIAFDVADLMNVLQFGRVKIGYRAALIFIVAENHVPLAGIHCFWHWWYRQTQIPFYQHYRNRKDRAWAGIVALISFMVFLAVTGLIIWGDEVVKNWWALQVTYMIEVSGLMFVLAQAWLSWRDPQEAVIARCRRLHEIINDRLQEQLSVPRQDLRDFLGK